MGVIMYQDKMYSCGNGYSYGGNVAPSSSIGNDGDYYYLWDASGKVQVTYVKISGEWHEIAGGDISIGESYYTDRGNDVLMAIMSDEDAMAHEGIKEEEE